MEGGYPGYPLLARSVYLESGARFQSEDTLPLKNSDETMGSPRNIESPARVVPPPRH
jgi:hypothetical protein